MAKVKPYYASGSLSAAFYDTITDADMLLRGDEDIYAGLAPAGGTMLELGAGTGRLTLGLARRGFHVTGVDLSSAMLAQARSRLAAEPDDIRSRVTLRQGDMTAIDLKARFDAVICPFFTLAHVPAGTAWRNTFANVARHLAPGGVAAFHLPRLDTMSSATPADPNRLVMDHPLEDGRRLRLFLRERTFRAGVNRMDLTMDYVLVDPRGAVQQTSTERLTFYMSDPEPLAAAAGLALREPPIELGGVGDVWLFRPA